MTNDTIFARLLRNSGTIFLGNSAASAFNIVSFSLLARAVGAELLAVFALCQTYAALINDIFNVQTWESVVKFGSANPSDQELGSLIRTNVVIDTVSAVIACGAALLLLLPVSVAAGWSKSYLPMISFYALTILFNSTTLAIGVPRLLREFTGVARIQIGVAVLRLAAVGTCYFMKGEAAVFIGVYICMDILANLLLTCYGARLATRRLGRKWWSSRMHISREQVGFIWWTNLRTIIRVPVRHFDVIVISSVISMEALGCYKVYKEIVKVIANVADPVSQAVFPEFTKLIGSDRFDESVALARKSMAALSLVSVALCGALCLAAGVIVKAFFGAQFLGRLPVLYLMIMVAGLSFATSPINSLFIAAGYAKASFYVVVVTNTVYLAMAYLCGSAFGLVGIVVANATQFVLNKELKVWVMKRTGRWTREPRVAPG
ncbi:oligosaccharide flippase family protein [Geomonas subterranea]|uniref:Oligosaccharide flippase family protein n=1 Tax=Geomonas subterranea TaxID=2847989 RepID=A0ABX8LI05_9BACT|nr:oligosaccharide flippase family protein [Geomonas subterranea]QXE91670.1 oligosaccharide flippase family protein [Geomonas subterranea]QXM10236.1 oligosaccharide flippase family protein [Geomonas subterranea]